MVLSSSVYVLRIVRPAAEQPQAPEPAEVVEAQGQRIKPGHAGQQVAGNQSYAEREEYGQQQGYSQHQPQLPQSQRLRTVYAQVVFAPVYQQHYGAESAGCQNGVQQDLHRRTDDMSQQPSSHHAEAYTSLHRKISVVAAAVAGMKQQQYGYQCQQQYGQFAHGAVGGCQFHFLTSGTVAVGQVALGVVYYPHFLVQYFLQSVHGAYRLLSGDVAVLYGLLLAQLVGASHEQYRQCQQAYHGVGYYQVAFFSVAVLSRPVTSDVQCQSCCDEDYQRYQCGHGCMF